MPYIHGKPLIKIAMADDHILLREALAAMIDSIDNCKVIMQADNGKQFLEQFNPQNLPDLALIDLQMPEMNGYDTIKEVKKMYPQLKILVLSVYGSEESILRILKAGAEGFIYKHERPDTFKRALNEIMYKGYYFTDQTAAGFVRQILKTGKLAPKNDLSDKEIAFLKQISTDKTYKEIAVVMGIPERQIEYLRNILFERFEVQSRTGLATQSIEKGLTI